MVVSLVASGCIKPVKAGARCRTAEWGQDAANFVLKCERGRWVRKATVAQVAQFYAAVLAAKTSTTPAPPPPPPTVKAGSTPPTTQYIPPSPAAGVSVGYGTACGWLANARIKCWGDNSQGALAIGNTSPYLIPIQPIFGPRGTGVSIGTGHVCALQASLQMECWGRNDFGQLGNTVKGPPIPYPSTTGGLNNIATIAGGAEWSCVSLANGSVKCWGNNGFNQVSVEAKDKSIPIPGAAAGSASNSTPHSLPSLPVRPW